MKTLSCGKYKTMFPESMAELSETQLLDLAGCYASNKNLIDAKVWLARKWAPQVFKANEARIMDTLERLKRTDLTSQQEILTERLYDCDMNRYYLSELANWITAEQVCDKWIIQRLTLPKFWLFKKEFGGPSLRFGNIQFWEWCRAEEYFSQYITHNDRTAFNKFCACLYHPIEHSLRTPFSDELIQKNHHYFNKLTPAQVYAIRVNYIAVKNWLRSVFKELFTARKDDSDVDGEDMADLLLRHADIQKVHYKIVEKDPVLVALKQMNNRAKDAKEAAERSENND